MPSWLMPHPSAPVNPCAAHAECCPMVRRSMGNQYSMRMIHDCNSGQTSEEGGLFMPFVRESPKELAACTGVSWGQGKDTSPENLVWTLLIRLIYGCSPWHTVGNALRANLAGPSGVALLDHVLTAQNRSPSMCGVFSLARPPVIFQSDSTFHSCRGNLLSGPHAGYSHRVRFRDKIRCHARSGYRDRRGARIPVN